MQSKHYVLNQNLDANKILHDIKSMINNHIKLGRKLEDTVLSIGIKDISLTYDEEIKSLAYDEEIKNDRKNALPE